MVFVMYLIVEFSPRTTEPHPSTEIIPSNWEKNSVCFWPPYRGDRLKRAVTTAETPSTSWKTYRVRVLYQSETLEKAEKKLPHSIYTSGLQTEAEEATKSRKRRRVRKVWSSDSDSDDISHAVSSLHKKPSSKSAKSTILPSPPLPPTPPPFPSLTITNLLSPLEDTADTLSNSTSMQLPKESCSTNVSKDTVCPAVNQKVLLELETLKLQVNHLTGLVREIHAKLVSSSENTLLPSTFECDILPCRSIEDIEQLEEKLNDLTFKKQLINHLAIVGGSTIKETVANILSRLLTNPLFECLNWSGLNGKRSFGKLKICTVAICAVRMNTLLTGVQENVIQKCMAAWIRGWKDRNGGRSKRGIICIN